MSPAVRVHPPRDHGLPFSCQHAELHVTIGPAMCLQGLFGFRVQPSGFKARVSEPRIHGQGDTTHLHDSHGGIDQACPPALAKQRPSAGVKATGGAERPIPGPIETLELERARRITCEKCGNWSVEFESRHSE